MSLVFDHAYFKELHKDNYSVKEGTVILTDGTSILKKNLVIKDNNNEPGLFTVYSHTCHHCHTIKPVLKKLKELLLDNKMDNSIICGTNINNNDNKEIIDILNIEAVPKLYIIKSNGEIVQFNGDIHSSESILQSIKTYITTYENRDENINKLSIKKEAKKSKKNKKAKKSKKSKKSNTAKKTTKGKKSKKSNTVKKTTKGKKSKKSKKSNTVKQAKKRKSSIKRKISKKSKK
jgi:thioredoxin-like negative regulator of GroEL